MTPTLSRFKVYLKNTPKYSLCTPLYKMHSSAVKIIFAPNTCKVNLEHRDREGYEISWDMSYLKSYLFELSLCWV